MVKKIFFNLFFILCVACSTNTNNYVDLSSASFGALTGKSKIVQKPALIKIKFVLPCLKVTTLLKRIPKRQNT